MRIPRRLLNKNERERIARLMNGGALRVNTLDELFASREQSKSIAMAHVARFHVQIATKILQRAKQRPVTR
jgi:hypothetical protein